MEKAAPHHETGPAADGAAALAADGGRRRPAVALLAVLVAFGVFLRSWGLADAPCWADEAESCINALTILDRGVPAHEYLGVPVYENTLTIPWPENPEFEFKDSSYSSRGVTVYHGWLPLYSIAASYAVAGVKPDVDPAFRGVKHSSQEMRRRTSAGRWPSVLFGGLFLLAAFGAAREMHGPAAGWVALAAGIVLAPAIDYARQARYYSATLALATCCCWLLWRVHRRGGWGDFLLGAAVLGLLFHTHALSFVVALAAGGLLLPSVLRHERAWWKLGAAGVVVSVIVLPWVVLSGVLGNATDVPMARHLLQFPRDYVAFAGRNLPLVAAAGLAAAVLVAAPRVRARLRGSVITRALEPLAGPGRPAMLFLAAWAVLGFVGFLLLMPAASFFAPRMVLTGLAPTLLFAAVLFAAAGRAVSPRHPALVGSTLLVLVLAAAGQARFRPPGAPQRSTYDVLEALRSEDILAGAKVYATPSDHLVFTLYSGMPVASVAPVRRAFLDAYPGDVFLLELPKYEMLDARDVRAEARRQGRDLSRFSDAELLRLVEGWLPREELRERGVVEVRPSPEPLPPELAACMPAIAQLQKDKTRQRSERRATNPIFKGYALPDNASWWPVFFYRFIGPEARSGPHLNYADRVRGAGVRVLPLEWTLYHSPARLRSPT